MVYRSQVLCVAKVSGAPACSRGFPRPGWAAGSFPSCCLTPNVTQLKTQQLLPKPLHLQLCLPSIFPYLTWTSPTKPPGLDMGSSHRLPWDSAQISVTGHVILCRYRG